MKTIFIGSLGGGNVPNDGVSVKNYHIVGKLKRYCKRLKIIDTQNWKKNPFVLFHILYILITHPKSKYILSLNNNSAYRLIRIINKIAPKAEIIYWVIGGTIGKWILEGRIKKEPYGKLKEIIVEGQSMKDDLEKAGLRNVSVMPNFKSIPKIEKSKKEINQDKLKLVFLSRVTPDKGCDLIIDAAAKLNMEGYKDKYSIDFYGPIGEEYKQIFLEKKKDVDNLTYKGFIDLRDLGNYNLLAGYDAMLFPTYWHGEGFPGIIIDSYACGLPILASDWNMNKDFIIHGETGIIFEPKSVNAITKTIKDCINGDIDLEEMSKNCFKTVSRFDIEEVFSKENLKKYGIID